jgi:thiamine-monophosphate kinase
MFQSGEENNDRTELTELGEFGLIDSIAEKVKIQLPSTIKGIGDDAAVLDYKGMETVISTDMLIEGVHFDLSYVPLKHLGYKAIAVNLSDILAMNAIPQHVTVSVALSNRFSKEAVDELYSGILNACSTYQVDLIGGDTTSSVSGLVISVTAIGAANKENLVYRDGAKEGNLLITSGDLGGAYMGLQMLEREKGIFKDSDNVQPDLEGMEYILERQLKPEPRKDVILELETMGVKPTSMIDVSDGLASEIFHLCKSSNVGVELYEDKIPIDQQTFDIALENHLDPTVCALSGGEDYELLFSVDINEFKKFKAHPMFKVIGHFTDVGQGYNLIAKNGTRHELQAQGWNSFNK